jgi:hypothetical protein
VAGALTPKPIIWYVMQITKIHFLPTRQKPNLKDRIVRQCCVISFAADRRPRSSSK